MERGLDRVQRQVPLVMGQPQRFVGPVISPYTAGACQFGVGLTFGNQIQYSGDEALASCFPARLEPS